MLMDEQSIQVVGAYEIRVRLGGVSRQRVYQITSGEGFPRPVADLAQGKVWLAADVEAWAQANRRNSASPALVSVPVAEN